ncbi:MAG: hypothetical protein Q9173_005546 [Seirophora scorigena]
MAASCWTSLNVDNFFGSWTKTTIMANPPKIGTLHCRAHEVWAQCFLRFAYGWQRQKNAPMDCSTFNATSCQGPADSLAAKPTSAEYWYGAQAISAVFTYIKAISSALLSTTGKPGVLESAYAAANAGTDFSDSPVDATLVYLLSIKGSSDQDNAFAAYMKASPYAGNFTGATDAKPDDVAIYRGLIAMLESRLDELMSGWEAFQQVTTEGQVWMEKMPEAEEFVQKWTVDGVGQALDRLTGGAGLSSTA